MPATRPSTPLTIGRATPADHPDIQRLLDEARGNDLDEAQRAERGFVQGTLDAATLARFQDGPGIFVARDGAVMAGVAVTGLPAMASAGPAAEMVDAVRQARPELPLAELFLYGPVAVDRRYQGRGLLTRLLTEVCRAMRGRFGLGVAFVDGANAKSLAVHRHYPMAQTATFELNGRHYTVFTFTPEQVLRHYGLIE